VQFIQAEEHSVAQGEQNPALGNLNTHFSLGLMLWLACAGRHRRCVIVPQTFPISWVDDDLVTLSAQYGRLQIVRYYPLRHAAQLGKAVNVTLKPVCRG